MNILRRHTVSSVLKVGFTVALLASVMLLGVDLFRNLDTYISRSVPTEQVIRLTLLFFPQAMVFALGPAFLFSVTYFLSMFHASNEIIAVLNSTISYRRVIVPIVFCGIAVSLFQFGFNEAVVLPSVSQKESLMSAITSDNSQSGDNYRIALSDMTQSFMVYAGMYSDSEKSLHGVTLIKVLEDGSIVRTNAERAVWDDSAGIWVFYNARTYTSRADGSSTEIRYYESEENPYLDLEPDMFRNLSNDIARMPLRRAGAYVRRMRTLDANQYNEMASSYYQRIFDCLTPLVMVIIACTMNYRFKRNVLFISLVFSVAIAVVYYVVRMMTTMMAEQGVITPYMGPLAPFAVILFLGAAGSYYMGKR